MRNIVRLTFLHNHTAVLVIIALIASLSVAQLNPGSFIQFDLQDGLPGSQENCPIQDKFSYVWLGAINGLAQYNSTTKLSRQYNYHDLIDNLVNTLKGITAKLNGKGTAFENLVNYDID